MATRGRFGFWFPLALLGFLALGSAAFAQGGWWLAARETDSSPTTTVLRGLQMSREYERYLLDPGVIYPPTAWPSTTSAEYWICGVLVVLQAAVVWYAHGSGQVRVFAAGAVWGVLAIVGFSGMMWIVDEAQDLAPTIAGSLLAIGLCAAAWVYFQLGRGKSVLTAISVVTVAVGATCLLATWTSYRADQLLVAGCLFVLAWWERSLLVAALAGALLVIDAVSLSTTIEVVLVTALLFACAFVALARRRGQADPVPPDGSE